MSEGRWGAAREILRRRALRRVLLLLAVGAALAFLAPRARRAARDWSHDEVRRRAIDALREASGASVEIDEATVSSMRELRLRGVRITGVPSRPEIGSVVIEEAILVPGGGETVAGAWSSIESLVLTGAVLTLEPRAATGAPREASPPPPIGRLVVRDATLIVDRAAGVGAFGLDAQLSDVGGAMHGEVSARSHRVPLRGALAAFASEEALRRLEPALARFGPCCGALAARIRVLPDGRLEADGELEIPEGSVPGEPASTARLLARIEAPDASGTRALSVELDAPGLVAIAARLSHAPSGLAWSDATVTLPRLVPAMLGADLPEGLLWKEARAVARLAPAPGDALDVAIDASATDLRAGDGPSAGEVTATMSGRAFSPARFEGVVEALAPSVERGDLRLRDVGVSWRGVAAPGRVEGDAFIALAGREALSLRGVAEIAEASAGASLDLRLHANVLARHPEMLSVEGLLPEGWELEGHDALSGTLAWTSPRQDGAPSSWRVALERTSTRWSVALPSPSGEAPREALRVHVTLSGSAEAAGAPDPPGSFTWRGEGEAASPALAGILRARASGRGGAGVAEASGSFEGFDARQVAERIAPGALRGLPEGAALGGIDGEFTASRSAAGDAVLDASARVGSIALQSADFTRALSLPPVPVTLRAEREPDGRVVARASARLQAGQVLWDAAYADLARLPPAIDASVVLPSGSSGTGWSADVSVAAGGIATMRGRFAPAAGAAGEGADGGIACDVGLDVPDLASAWRVLGDAGLLQVSEGLSDFAPAGSLRATGEGRLGESGSLDAIIEVLDGGLSHAPTRLWLEGLAAEMPLRLERGPGDPWRLAPGSAPGRIRASLVEIVGAEARDVSVPVQAGDDLLRVGDDVVLSVLGGTATLSGVTLERPLSPGRALSAGFALSGLRLEELGPVGPFRLSGRVSANLPRVSASATRLHVEGGARIAAWGGEILIDEIAGENPWSRFPRLRVAASFREVDLHELTSTFGFGAMTGLVEGDIRSFELLGSTPVRFDASVRSAPGDVPRIISIPALQNLATLATGGRAPLFDKGLLKLVGRLRYEELGLRARLQGDEFMLQGLAERNGRELYLKGRLPLRVDVANAQPGATVSFRAMMNRLQGLEGVPSAAGAAAAAGDR